MAKTVCGTPEYMAPAILNGECYDKSVDWWATGILIYEMLIGKTPFIADNRDKLNTNILTKDPEFPA